MKSTHYVFLPDGPFILAKVCGRYYRKLMANTFGGGLYITGWMRLPDNIKMIPHIADMVPIEGSGILGTSDNLK